MKIMGDEEMKGIFSESQNDLFSLYSENERCFLCKRILDGKLTYRDYLGLDGYTFGTEIEYEGKKKRYVDKFIYDNYSDWESSSDGTLVFGGEVQSPILRDKIKCWRELKEVCVFLRGCGAETSDRTGGHVHVGAHVLLDDAEAWLRFIKVYTVYENILIRFFTGDSSCWRGNAIYYAKPIGDILYNNLSTYNRDLPIRFWHLPDEKYCAINFLNASEYNSLNVRNTLEFRSPNATLSEIIWQNNINTIGKLLKSSIEGNIDMDFIDYKLNNERVSFFEDRERYFLLDVQGALELVDIIFDNNLDKVYFLRQYLKDNIGYGNTSFDRCKKLVR